MSKPKAPAGQRCGNCAHLRGQQFDKRGRLKKLPYRCGYPIIIPPLPDAVTLSYGYYPPKAAIAMWADMGTTCPTWAAQPSKENGATKDLP